MILSQVFQKVRRLTNTTSTTLPDSRLIDLANEAFLYIQRSLANEEIEALGVIAKTDLIANQPNYQLPVDNLKILRIEVNYSDTNDITKWKKVSGSDLGNLPQEWYSLIKSQSLSRPLYDLFGSNIWLFPSPTQDQILGLRLWYIAKQPDFTSVNNVLHPILEKYYDVFALKIANLYLEEIGDPMAQRKYELAELGIKKMIEDLKVETIEPIKITPINYFSSGWL